MVCKAESVVVNVLGQGELTIDQLRFASMT